MTIYVLFILTFQIFINRAAIKITDPELAMMFLCGLTGSADGKADGNSAEQSSVAILFRLFHYFHLIICRAVKAHIRTADI